jgi:hypothetical protein
VLDGDGGQSRSPNVQGRGRLKLDHRDVEVALRLAGTWEQNFHGRAEAFFGAGWAGHQQGSLTMAELRVEDEERKPTKVVAVQMGQGYCLYLCGLDARTLHRDEGRRTAVEQHRRRRVPLEMDAGLKAAAGTEGVA